MNILPIRANLKFDNSQITAQTQSKEVGAQAKTSPYRYTSVKKDGNSYNWKLDEVLDYCEGYTLTVEDNTIKLLKNTSSYGKFEDNYSNKTITLDRKNKILKGEEQSGNAMATWEVTVSNEDLTKLEEKIKETDKNPEQAKELAKMLLDTKENTSKNISAMTQKMNQIFQYPFFTYPSYYYIYPVFPMIPPIVDSYSIW